MISSLKLYKFTVFDDIKIDFSPGVNIFIGRNGTGKTHILKVLYSLMSSHLDDERVEDKLVEVFLPKDKRIGRLVQRGVGVARADVEVVLDKKKNRISFSSRESDGVKAASSWKGISGGASVYIPVKEMLANAPGFLALYENREIHFESIYADILLKAYLPPLRGPQTGERKELMGMIQNVIEGRVLEKNGEFYLKNRQGELEFTLLSEGFRKLGLLWLLIQNGTLSKGTTLFWDEPETNLNPTMITFLVDILMYLQRIGVQIFIATHDYFVLKNFDFKAKETDAIRFFSLSRNGKQKIESISGDSYQSIIPNAIDSSFAAVYDKEIEGLMDR